MGNEILAKAKHHVTKLLKGQLLHQLVFHNVEHTLEVVEHTKALTEEADLTDEDKEDLILAAWFHDTGFIKHYDNHEHESALLAEQFLKDNNLSNQRIERIKSLIISTKNDHVPQNFLEELINDADIAHMGRKRFFRKGDLLRIELEKVKEQTFSELEWEKIQYQFLTDSRFHTRAAKKLYGKRRIKNIKKQRENIIKARKITIRTKTGKDLGRGIDTLYRANYRNHINLSAIADGKANMMISINTIMISVIVTLSGASLSVSKEYIVENLRYTIPILILLVGSLISVIFAVLSARPTITSVDIDDEKIKKDEVSLLYFGNFLGIPKQRFVEYLNNLKLDQSRLYDTMSMDLYNLGLVLRKKYQLLTVSYNIFMTGLILTVLAFISVFLYTNL